MRIGRLICSLSLAVLILMGAIGYLTSDPVITANWNAGSSNRWTLPLGGWVGKLFKIGNQPINTKLQFYGNAVKPDNGPKWLMRFTIQFLFPK